MASFGTRRKNENEFRPLYFDVVYLSPQSRLRLLLYHSSNPPFAFDRWTLLQNWYHLRSLSFCCWAPSIHDCTWSRYTSYRLTPRQGGVNPLPTLVKRWLTDSTTLAFIKNNAHQISFVQLTECMLCALSNPSSIFIHLYLGFVIGSGLFTWDDAGLYRVGKAGTNLPPAL